MAADMDVSEKGASGGMVLKSHHQARSGKVSRLLRLQAGIDGHSVLLLDIDEDKVGIQRTCLIKITTDELVAFIRAHGAELPGETHVDTGANKA